MKKIYIFSIVSFVTLCILGIGLFFLLNNKSESSVEEFYKVTLFNDGLVLVREGNHYKYLDKSGKVVIEDFFFSAQCFIKEKAIVSQLIDNEIQYTLIDKKGENAINNQFFTNLTYDLDASLYIYGRNSKYGLMDSNGKIITEPTYVEILPFREGISTVTNDDYTYSFINKQGKLINEVKYNDVINFSNGLVIVVQNTKYGAINETGEVVLPLEFSYIERFNERGYSLAKTYDYETNTEKRMIIDKSGKETYTTTDMRIISVGNYFIISQSNNGYHLINEKGEELLDETLTNYTYNFTYNYYIFVYSKSDQQYIVAYDEDLNLLFEVEAEDYISLSYDRTNNELFLVTKVSEGIKIDYSFRSFIYECNSDSVNIIGSSYNGYYVIRDNNLYGVIDSRGRVVIDITHRDVILTSDGYAIVKDEKVGVYNLTQNIVIPQHYDKIEVYYDYNYK